MRRDLADRLEPYRDDIDRLIVQARRSWLSQSDYDRLESDAAVLCAGIRAAFRGKSDR